MTNPEDIKNICISTAKRSILRQYRYHLLDRTRLSEPEIRHVMTKILDEKRIFHGIEIATKYKHKITGISRERSALVDLVIFDNNDHHSIWMEFKRGQTDPKNIKKDFIKMVKEKSETLKGVCFFHIIPVSLNKTKSQKNLQKARNSIIDKYSQAYNQTPKEGCSTKWFILFILDAESREYYLHFENDVCNIKEFPKEKWSRLG